MRTVRITFRSEVFISGETIDEIRSKWNSLSLFSEEALKCQAELVEEVSTEDAETYDDISDEWDPDDTDDDLEEDDVLNL